MDRKRHLYPLPLTSFEEYLFSDDSPAYPMTVTFRLRFSGFLDPEAFRNAFSIVMPRHPLLRATVSRKRFGGLIWTDYPDWLPTIHWHAQGDKNGFPETPFMDLTKEPGILVWVLDRDNGHDIVMQIHHCCTDGKGFLLFIEDLLIAYTMNQSPSETGVALRQLDPHGLRKRATPELHGWKCLKAVFMQIGVLNEIRQFLMRTPAPLTDTHQVSPEKAPPAAHTAPLFFLFDQKETTQFFSAAKYFNATSNELLLRDLYLAVGAWRERKGVGHVGDWLRFSIPVNLRGSEQEKMPMANSISLLFLDVRMQDFTDRGCLLHTIRDFMKSINRLYRKYTFIFSVGAARFLPGGLKRFTQNSKCYATTCFSNVGRVLDTVPLPLSDGKVVAGNVLLESVDIVPPPLRPHMNASFMVYTYAGRLQLGIKYDSRNLSEQNARDLLNMFVEEIRRSVQESSECEQDITPARFRKEH
jgi:NRPS condensation-like uncharacterized protein